MKKLLKGILLGALMLTLVACGNNNSGSENVKVDLGALMEQIITDNFAEAAFIDYDEEYLSYMMELDLETVVDAKKLLSDINHKITTVIE